MVAGSIAGVTVAEDVSLGGAFLSQPLLFNVAGGVSFLGCMACSGMGSTGFLPHWLELLMLTVLVFISPSSTW
jgi:hypothetical protein